MSPATEYQRDEAEESLVIFLTMEKTGTGNYTQNG